MYTFILLKLFSIYSGNTWSFFNCIYLFINLELLQINLCIYSTEAIYNKFGKYLELFSFYLFIPKPGAYSNESTFLEPHSKDILYIWSFFQLTSLFKTNFKLYKKSILLKLYSILLLVQWELFSINLLY